MSGILRSIWCIPCLLTLFCLMGTVGVTSFIRNNWCPFLGSVPTDGPVEGFASKAARIDFYDTTPRRVRMATLFGVIGFITWAVGFFVALVILNSLG